MIKKISLSMLLTLSVCFKSISIEIPKINYFKDKINFYTPGTFFAYNRDYSKNDIFVDKYKKIAKILQDNTKILVYEDKEFIEAIYIIKNEKSIGYCLLSTFELPNDSNSQMLLKPIKELKKDESYLKNDLKRFRGLEVIFYYNKKNNFVERYAFLKISNQKSRNILLMESFYPKSLENEIKPYIIAKLNKNLYSMSVDPFGNPINNEGKDEAKNKGSGNKDSDKRR